MPMIALAPEFPLQNPHGSIFLFGWFCLCRGEVKVVVEQSPTQALGLEPQKGF